MKASLDKNGRALHVGARVRVNMKGSGRTGKITYFEDETGSVWIDQTDLNGFAAMPEELELMD